MRINMLPLAFLTLAGPAFACEPLGYDKTTLLDASGAFVMPADADVDRMTLALADCLDHPDPEWRDAIGYMGITTLLRGGDVAALTVRELRDGLSAVLAGKDPSGDGFAKPFAALAMAEVARVDRVSPLFSDEERASLVDTAVTYVSGIRDYRGFAPAEGWRHGVAHGADLLMQLVLNPELDEVHVRPIIEAALSQVNAADDHAYVFGESLRLARPVLFAAQRELVSPDEWQTYFGALTEPPGESWSTSFSTVAGQSRLHNSRAFLLSIYSSVAESENEIYRGIRDAARAALGALP